MESVRWRRRARVWLAAIALLACAHLAHALDPARPVDSYALETWDTERGLPHNLVHAIAQTPDGYLWFGSWEGVARFNAWDFRVFDADHDGVLRNNGVRALARGSDGALWIGTSEGGLTRYADSRWKQYGEADGLDAGSIRSMLATREGKVWIGTEENGVIVFDGKRFMPATLPNALVLALAEAPDGSVWIGTSRGLAHWRDGELVPVPELAPEWQPTIFAIHADGDGLVRVGTERGLYRIDGDRAELESEDAPLAQDSISAIVADDSGSLWVGTFQSGLVRVRARRAEVLTQKEGLPHNRVASLFEDREGSLWVGTGLGLARLGDAPFTTLAERRGLSDSYVRSIAQDTRGTLWVGTGNGLNRLVDGRFETLYPGGRSAASSIMSLYPARDGGLWVGTRDAGIARWDGSAFTFSDASAGLAGNQVRALREARDGALWVGTSGGVSRIRDGRIENFGRADGLPRAYSMALYEDRDDAIWVGTSNGAARFDGTRFQDQTGVPGAPLNDVFDFHQDADGGLWLATSSGLYRWKHGRYAQIPRAAGELPRQLFSVLEGQAGNLWFSSNSGVYRVARAELDAVADGTAQRFDSMRYGHRDGMATAQGNGSSQPAAWRASDGRLWFATAGGAAVVDPRHADIGPVPPPPIVIERVLVDGEEPAVAQGFEVPADARRVIIEYAALAYRRPDHVNYRFRLAGFESDWVSIGPQRATVFTNLRPGDYTFEVEPDDKFPGFEPTRASVRFRVLPHFYETTWFYTLLALALVLGVAMGYRLRVAGLVRRKLQLEKLVTERTDALGQETRKLQSANEQKAELLEKVREQAEAFERLSREDALTGLPNRRHFDTWLRSEFARCRREGIPLAVAALDVDHFKRINDRHSHAVGDDALRVVADKIRTACGSAGMPARYGGEEFVLAFPGMDTRAVTALCERLREAIERHEWQRIAPGLAVTVSVGVSDDPGAPSHERLLAIADSKLYEAKAAGRNRVCV